MTERQADVPSEMRTAVRSYKTRFERDESPLSEDGMWLNGRKDGIDWADVITRDGLAHGDVTRMDVAERRVEQGNLELAAAEDSAPVGDYDDPTAVLSGRWGPDQHARATVFSRSPTSEYFQEVEIRLRSTMTPHRCTGYEVFFRCLKTEEGYAEIVRWNGAAGDFTSLKKLFGPQYGVKHGDVIEGRVDGSLLRGFVNGVELISATDRTFVDGSPGVGFNFGVGNTNVDHGLTSFEVETFEQ